MDNRSHKRFKVCGDISGKMVFPSDVEVIDISINGIHFNCTNRLTINSTCMIQLFHEDTPFIINGVIVRSIFKGIKTTEKNPTSVYEIAMYFDNLDEFEQQCLNALISKFENGQTI